MRRYRQRPIKPEAVNPATLQFDPQWVRPPRFSRPRPGRTGSSGTCTTRRSEGSPRSYPISAVYGDTPTGPLGPVVMPGKYTVRLTVDGKAFEQPLDGQDGPAGHDAGRRVGAAVQTLDALLQRDGGARLRGLQVRAVRRQLEDRKAKAAELAVMIDAIDAKLTGLSKGQRAAGRESATPNRRKRAWAAPPASSGRLLAILQGADATPTTQATSAVTEAKKELDGLFARSAVSGRRTWPTSMSS